MDIVPIIPDVEPKVRREPYNLALSKIIRANDHKIISTSIKYIGSTVHIELNLQCDKELAEKLDNIKDTKTKEEQNISDILESSTKFLERIRRQEGENLRYQGDNPF